MRPSKSKLKPCWDMESLPLSPSSCPRSDSILLHKQKNMEITAVSRGTADTEPTHKKGRAHRPNLVLTGAGNGIRTRDLQLGKLTLYH